MRRLAALTTGVLAAVTLVAAPALVGTGSAATLMPFAKPVVHAVAQAKPAHKAKPAKPIVLVGVVSATPTVSTATTATSTVTLRIKHVSGTVSVLVDASTVVKRDSGRKSRYELTLGDKVVVFARRVNGVLVATYVAASGRNDDRPVPVGSSPSATSTATTTATVDEVAPPKAPAHHGHGRGH